MLLAEVSGSSVSPDDTLGPRLIESVHDRRGVGMSDIASSSCCLQLTDEPAARSLSHRSPREKAGR